MIILNALFDRTRNMLKNKDGVFRNHGIFVSSHPNAQRWPQPEQNSAADEFAKPYLLFDAGGTLVFPDQPFLIEQAWAQGVELTDEQLFAGYCRLIHALDCQARQSGDPPADPPWRQDYTSDLMEILGLAGPASQAVARAAETRHQWKSLWTFTFPWIHRTLSCLKDQGYRMSVISNSDHCTRRILSEIGLDGYFEGIFYSARLGIAKPDPAIFEAALRKLNLRQADAIYIGDIYYVDVLGANQAGIGAVHLDPLGLYADWPGVHLPSIRQLPDWLARYEIAPLGFDLFPFRASASSPLGRKQPGAAVDKPSTAVQMAATGLQLRTERF